MPRKLAPFGPSDRYRGTHAESVDLHGYATSLITGFLASTSLGNKRGLSRVSLKIQPQARDQVDILKQFTWHYVILGADLIDVQKGQRTAIKEVFRSLLEAAESRKLYLFPPFYHACLDEAKNKNDRVRITADCISGMTEKELMLFYRRLTGISD